MRYRPNPAFEKQWRKSPEVVGEINRRTVILAGYIKTAALPSRNTGYYMRRIVPVGNRVRTKDNFFHLIEYGSRNNPPYAPVRRGTIASGLRFDDPGRPG